MDRRKVTLNYFQAELCLIVLQVNKEPVNIKVLKSVHSLIERFREIPPRPTVPTPPPEGSEEDVREKYLTEKEDSSIANQDMNKMEIEFLFYKEEFEVLRERLRTYKNFNTSNDYAREQIISLARIVGI